VKNVNLASQEKRAEAPPPACAEHKLQRQLRRSRAADLKQRTETTLAAASERSSQHLCGLAELRRTQIVNRRREIRVIENVEEICSRLQGNPLSEFELPA
jgi:hypothetical protein